MMVFQRVTCLVKFCPIKKEKFTWCVGKYVRQVQQTNKDGYSTKKCSRHVIQQKRYTGIRDSFLPAVVSGQLQAFGIRDHMICRQFHTSSNVAASKKPSDDDGVVKKRKSKSTKRTAQDKVKNIEKEDVLVNEKEDVLVDETKTSSEQKDFQSTVHTVHDGIVKKGKSKSKKRTARDKVKNIEKEDVLVNQMEDVLVDEKEDVLVDEKEDMLVDEKEDVLVDEKEDVLVNEKEDMLVDEKEDVLVDETKTSSEQEDQEDFQSTVHTDQNQADDEDFGDDLKSIDGSESSAEIDKLTEDEIQSTNTVKFVPVKEKPAPLFEIPLTSVLNPASMKRVLLSHQLSVNDGYTCFVTMCPKAPNVNKTNNQLFINKKTGYFVCRRCNKEGPWASLQENIARLTRVDRKGKLKECMELDQNVISHDSSTKSAEKVLKSAKPVTELSDEEYKILQQSFQCEGLTKETMSQYQVHYDVSQNAVIFPYFYPSGILKGVKKLQSGQKPRTTYFPKHEGYPLFGWQCLGYNRQVKSSTNIILTVNEFNTMAVSQSTNALVLGLPRGLSSLPIQILPSLEHYKKIYLWFSGDVEAWDPAKSFAMKLEEERCYIVRPSEENPGPLVSMQMGIDLVNVLRRFKAVYHKSIQTFSSLREHIRLELCHSDVVSGVKWKRFPTLNNLLKGHRRGELTIFTGPTGSGKTTFLSEYSLDLCMQGVNTLWGSFEISNIKLNKLMLTQYAVKNLSVHIEEYDKWASSFEQLPMYFMTFHGQESHKKVLETMTHAVYIHDVTHIIVDNLQFMMGVSSDNFERFSKQDAIIAAFRNFATQMNCHVTLIIHPRKERSEEDLTTASVFGSAKATQEADNVLILQDKRLTGVRGRKYIQVVKNRFDGELGVLMLRFDSESRTYSQGPKKKPTEEGKGVDDSSLD